MVDPLWYQQPVFYFSNPASLLGAYDPVAVSPGSRAFDYELISGVADRQVSGGCDCPRELSTALGWVYARCVDTIVGRRWAEAPSIPEALRPAPTDRKIHEVAALV